MARWDSVSDEAYRIFQITHPWLFNPGMTPEIIETEETLRLEEKNKVAEKEVMEAIVRLSKELFPDKPPVVVTQQDLL